ncbi:MAG: component of SufBCD complex [Rhodobacter sp.]|nr:component of SufBCD complex [Paracoccaceae bacterium]MCC0075382.1 component of SufBCD complex [Rhodobacter sp.]
MNGYDSIFSTIDVRSFSSIWFWIAVAVAWSNTTHFILGVPFDMVQRAKRRGGTVMEDLEVLTMIQVRRRLQIIRSGGVWLVAFWSAILTTLAMLGFGYGHELAQALTLLLLPLTLAAWLGLRMAARFEADPPSGAALTRALTLHRLLIQGIGLLAILITTMWGSWFNLTLRMFGG